MPPDPPDFAKQQRLREEFNTNQVQFLLTELDTALTFCEIAQSSTELEKTRRNIANACKGYETAMSLSRHAQFDDASRELFDQKVTILREHLRELGQTI